MREDGARNPPEGALLRNGPRHCLQRAVGHHHLVHACADRTPGEPLQLLARLDEQAAMRDADRYAPAITQPLEGGEEECIWVGADETLYLQVHQGRNRRRKISTWQNPSWSKATMYHTS